MIRKAPQLLQQGALACGHVCSAATPLQCLHTLNARAHLSCPSCLVAQALKALHDADAQAPKRNWKLARTPQQLAQEGEAVTRAPGPGARAVTPAGGGRFRRMSEMDRPTNWLKHVNYTQDRWYKQ